jgi:ureidoacrylate peracid hydrolase
MVDFSVTPARTALINVDMQNCFVEGYPISAPKGPEVLARINRLADVCRACGVKVIHTAHVVRPDGSNMGVMAEILPPVRDGVINEGSKSAALHAGLGVSPGDIILNKPRFGSFHGTDLELILRSNGIDTVIVSGIATNVCCETTAREANARDFRVFFLSDGTATFGIGDLSPDDIQKATCTTLGHVFAQVLTVDQMIAKIRAGADAARKAVA